MFDKVLNTPLVSKVRFFSQWILLLTEVYLRYQMQRIVRSSAETVPFRKISTPGNQVKLRCFTQRINLNCSKATEQTDLWFSIFYILGPAIEAKILSTLYKTIALLMLYSLFAQSAIASVIKFPIKHSSFRQFSIGSPTSVSPIILYKTSILFIHYQKKFFFYTYDIQLMLGKQNLLSPGPYFKKMGAPGGRIKIKKYKK